MTPGARKVVVVGAGPSGLAAAARAVEVARERGETPDVTVLEASPRAGGAIGTEVIDGFHAERGADGFLTEKRAVIELADRLGIGGRLVRTLPARDGAYVVHQGRLHPIPPGFSMMAPTRVRSFLKSGVVSWPGKVRALAEVVLPRGAPGEDESLASFVRRRFGEEILASLAQPLVSGIYGADPERLSLRATMPRFLDEETRSRSVILGLRRKARAQGETRGARYGLFASFDGGMQVLVDALVARLPDVRLREPVTEIVPTADGRITVRTGVGAYLADRVILALGGAPLTDITRTFDGALADGLARIEHGSCATVVFGWDTRVVPAHLDGFGLIVPARERRDAMAMTFLSRKWPGRAPDGSELIRVFLHDESGTDEQLIARAAAELSGLLSITRAPLFTRLRRWRGAMPQYHVGHLALARRIDERVAKHPWLRLAGNDLHGVGLPDAIAAGERAASLGELRAHRPTGRSWPHCLDGVRMGGRRAPPAGAPAAAGGALMPA